MEISYYGKVHKFGYDFYITDLRGRSWEKIEENFIDNCPKNTKLEGRSVKITIELKEEI
jgi:hypothetical protein